MPLKKAETRFVNRQFLIFFMSQNFVSCGAFIQIVAVAQLLVQSTNSGLVAGFSIVCAPLPGIVLSLFAGSIGDRLKTKKLLVVFDLLRGLLVILFIFCRSALSIFSVMLLISTLDVLYNPSKNKMLTSLLDRNDLLKGNSILNGGYGAISMVLPMVTGVIISACGIHSAFIVNSAFYLVSSILLSKLDSSFAHQKTLKQNNIQEIAKGLKYCFGLVKLKRAILTLAVIDFGTVSVNIAFYSFAFDTLHVTSNYWGLLLSVLYGMNVVSMVLLLRQKKQFEKNPLLVAHLLVIALTFVWGYYSSTNNLIYLMIGVAAEGLCSSLGNTLLITHILETAKKEYTARVMSIRDLISNISKVAGIGLTYVLMKFFKADFVFVISAALVFTYAVYQTASLVRNKMKANEVTLRRQHGGRYFYE